MSSVSRATATAFGLDIASEAPLAFLAGASAAATGRSVALSIRPDAQARALWPSDATLICDERQADDSVNFRIESHPKAGYLVWGPEYGAHRLSVDGSALACFPEGQPEGAWQRLLIAQVLPFAALLRGLEVFHASAVASAGSALAFVGPSHTGKTSLALELCRRGADFMADDVLALEPRDGVLLAQPGSPVAGVDHAAPQQQREPVLASNARESIVQMSGASEPLALSALFFLERRADGPAVPQLEPSTDALSLLTATFNFVLSTPERLRRLLEVCAMASQLQVETVAFGPAADTGAVADAIERRVATR